MQFHGYGLSDIEQMIPFERDIYVTLLIKHLEEEKIKLEALNNR